MINNIDLNKLNKKELIQLKNNINNILYAPAKQIVLNRISDHHCKYCNSILIIKKDNRQKPKRGKSQSYYSRSWICKNNCTRGVHYLFEEDRVYILDKKPKSLF